MSSDRLLVLPFLHAFGGVERLAVGLCRLLRERGLSHRVLCLQASIDLSSYAGWPIHVEVLRPARNPLAESLALRRRLRDERLPPLFFDLKGAFYAGVAARGAYYLHLTDPPSLLPRDLSKHAPSLGTRTLRSPLALMRAEAAHRLNRRGARRARRVVAMTETIAAELRALYGVDAQVLRPGVRVPEGIDGMPLSARSVRLLSVCRLEANKRIDWVLRALARLENPSYGLDIVGEGSERAALEKLAAELGLAAQVRFHGRASDAEVESLWAKASLFVMPAAQGYGLPALEALARGVPVVLHSDSGVAEILGGSPWAEILREGDDLLPALEKMIRHQVELAIDTRPHIPTEHDWAVQLSELCGWLTPAAR